MENTQDFEYYYVVGHSGQGMTFSCVMPQKRHESGGENPDGFNFVQAQLRLMEDFKCAVVVLSWQKITKRRAEEFFSVVAQMQATRGAPDQSKVRHLKVVEEKKYDA